MTFDELAAHCLAQPVAVAEHPFGPGTLVMKVAGKVFAILAEDADPVTISLKCDPELAAVLRQAYRGVVPGYHLNKRHWNTVSLDGSVRPVDVRGWVEDSYDLVVAGLPSRVRETLGVPSD